MRFSARRSSVALLAGMLTTTAACTLLTSLDGLSEPGAAADGGPLGDSAPAPRPDGAPPSEAGPPADASTLDAAGLSYPAEVLADSPLVYLRLGEMAGATTVIDATKNGNGGTIKGAPTLGVPGAIAGDPDTAFRFGGSGSIDLGPRFDFSGNSSFTLEAWVRLQVVDATYRHLFTKDVGVGPNREAYGVVVQQDAIFFQRYVGGSQILAGTGTASLIGRWAHVVSTYDGMLLRLYVDGKELGRTADARAQLTKASPFLVANKNTNDGPLLGDVDEVAVYDKPLDPARVLVHFQRGSGK